VAIGTVKLHYVDAKQKLDLWTTQVLLAPLSDDGKAALWDEAEVVADLAAATDAEPAAGAAFAELPGAALNAKTQAAWARQLAAHAHRAGAVHHARATRAAPAAHHGGSRCRVRAPRGHAPRCRARPDGSQQTQGRDRRGRLH